MNNRYADLRAAANLDLPPLPWHAPGLAELHDADDVCVACFSDCEPVEQERRPVPSINEGDRFALYVVAANPDIIRALLADFDEASARALHSDAVAETAIEQVKKLEVERDRLRAACEKAAEWLEGWASAEPYLSELRAALAQEQGESDGV